MDAFLLESISKLYRLLTWHPLATQIVSIFCGLMWCFFGYRIFRPLLVGTVALLGGIIGFSCAGAISSQLSAAIVGGLIGAIIGGLIGYIFVYVSVFLLGMSLTATAAWILFSTLSKMDPNSVLLSSLVIGAAGGLLALLLMRPLLVVYTALAGALWVVGTAVDMIITVPAFNNPQQFQRVYALHMQPFLDRFWPMIAIGVVVLFAAGAIYQFTAGKGGAEEGEARQQVRPVRKAKAA
jgi:hypothetical protein